MDANELKELLKSMGPLSEETSKLMDDMDENSHKRDESLKNILKNNR